MDGSTAQSSHPEFEKTVSIFDLEKAAVKIFDISDEIQRCMDDPAYGLKKYNADQRNSI
jgi:hypothetical protein